MHFDPVQNGHELLPGDYSGKIRTILGRVIDAIGRISGFFSSSEPAARHNPVLAKWDQYYDAHPNSFVHRRQNSALNYLTPTD